MKPRCWLIHGFNVRDGGVSTIGKLAVFADAEGFDPVVFRYGWLGLLGVRLMNKRFARMLASIAKEGDIAIAHSNGCAILNRACWMESELRRIVYINPALDYDMPLSPSVDVCNVWHSPSDKPVKWAALIPGHSWGKMGAYGYDGIDKRYTNFNKQSDFLRTSRSHSDIFSPWNIGYFGPLIFEKLRNQKRKLP